jgi:hypothetical protein
MNRYFLFLLTLFIVWLFYVTFAFCRISKPDKSYDSQWEIHSIAGSQNVYIYKINKESGAVFFVLNPKEPSNQTWNPILDSS